MSVFKPNSESPYTQVIPVRNDLRHLRETIRDIEHGFKPGDHPPHFIPTGWSQTDSALHGQGLCNGVVHEWFGIVPSDTAYSRSRSKHDWAPPLTILTHLGIRALDGPQEPHTGWLIWVGKRCWPYLSTLVQPVQRKLLIERSIFVDAPDLNRRLWAMEVALRSPATAAVIGDGSGLGMTATRRLQLAAQAGQSMALITRPPCESKLLSAATTRWRVGWEPTTNKSPRWRIELIRYKAVHPVSQSGKFETDGLHVFKGRQGLSQRLQWVVEWDHEKGVIAVPADVAGGSSQETAPAATLRTA